MSRYADLAECTSWTALQAGLAVWLVTGEFSLRALQVAGAAAVIAAAKCLLAFRIGDGASASTLPTSSTRTG